jgi:primosomal protein N' (replication factor Y)
MPGGGALRLTGRQLGLLRSLPRFAGDELGALRRLEVRGLVTVGAKARRRAPVHAVVGAAKAAAPPLTPEQRAAIDAIVSAPAGERILLHGVTGSARPRSTSGRWRRCSSAGRARSSSSPRSP